MQYSLEVNLELARSWSAASHRLDSIWEMLWKALAVMASFFVVSAIPLHRPPLLNHVAGSNTKEGQHSYEVGVSSR